MEYYILCPQRATEVPGLITHLISRDICERRQVENYHKCAGCIRSRIWREQSGHPQVAARNGVSVNGINGTMHAEPAIAATAARASGGA